MAVDNVIFSNNSFNGLFNQDQCFSKHNYDFKINVFMNFRQMKESPAKTDQYLIHLNNLKECFGGIVEIKEHTLKKKECVDYIDPKYVDLDGILISIDPAELKTQINKRLFYKILLMFVRAPYNKYQWNNIILPSLNVFSNEECKYSYVEVIFFVSQFYFFNGGKIRNTNHWVMDYGVNRNEIIRTFDIQHYDPQKYLEESFRKCDPVNEKSQDYKLIKNLISNELGKNNKKCIEYLH